MQFAQLPKLSRGDQVAVLSPSAGLPEVFPHVFEFGLKRLREDFGLSVKEYPTTRKMGAAPQDRARDLMDAFADPTVKAVIASIGGSDQITVLPHLHPEVFSANPKPFFGYSDNTNLSTFLWKLGIPSYYGGSVMCQFAMQGQMDPLTVRSLRAALFLRGAIRAEQATEFNEEELAWEDPTLLSQRRKYQPHEGNIWDAPDARAVQGRLYGGCLEVLSSIYTAGKWHPTDDQLDGVVFCLETSEEMPSVDTVRSFMMALGVRGIWSRVVALLVARPKTSFLGVPALPARETYRSEQQAAILEQFRVYNPTAPIVFNMNFGHTDPQLTLPLGHLTTVDPTRKEVIFAY